MGRNTAQQVSAGNDGFLFVGNQLALDFLNTRPVQNDQPVELLPDFSALARWFQAAGLLTARAATNLHEQWGKSDRAGRVAEAMRRLREELRREILAWEAGSTIHRSTANGMNRRLGEHPMLTRVAINGKKVSAQLYFELGEPENLFAPIVHSAAMLFAGTDRKRVRKCDQCVLHFLDTSKKGTRRWCSMQLCGNRMKVAAYAARQRAVVANR